MLDVTYGTITLADAERLARGSDSLDNVPHEPGSTEPWISQLVARFVMARDARTVLETGCFKGATSVHLWNAIRRLGGGTLVCCDIDPARLNATRARLEAMGTCAGGDSVALGFVPGDVLQFLRTTRMTFDLAWVDDNHEKPHVSEELRLLYPKMNKGGLILLHDVYGSCDLKTVVREFGGYSIDLPRMGPAGGLGIIQCL